MSAVCEARGLSDTHMVEPGMPLVSVGKPGQVKRIVNVSAHW